MKLRNAANSAWITLFQLDGEWSLIPFENGTAAAPSIYFKDSGTDTGLFSPGTDQVGITTGGSVRLTTSTTAFTGTLPWQGQNGTAAAPALSFSGDPNTGIYNVGADQLGISTNGTLRFDVSTTATTSTLPVVHPLGAVGTPSITFTGDTNTGIYSPGADQVAISTGGTVRLSLSTTAVSSALAIDHPLGAVGTPSITFTGDLNTGIYSPAADTIAFVEGGVEAMRIDTSGRLLVGTSSTSTDCRALFQARSGSSTTNTTVVFSGGNSAPATNEGLGYLAFSDSTHTLSAWVAGERDGGTWSGSSKPTRLVFYTTADGASSPTERMRIASNGELLVGGTNDNGAFNIQCNGTGIWAFGAYVNGSDERLKEDITPLAPTLEIVKQLNPVSFRYKEEYTSDTSIQPGFIAQELQQILEDQPYIDGIVQAGPEFLSVAYQSLIPVLTKALQEAIAKIETLEAKVAALEAA
jgi:hypothetical protein